MLVGDAGEQAYLASQRPENHRGLDAFAAQPLEHAQGMRGVTGECAVDQAEDVETRAVSDGGLDGFGVHLVAFGKQLELFDFLRSRQQVAFHPRGDHFHRVGTGAQPGLSQALAHPLR